MGWLEGAPMDRVDRIKHLTSPGLAQDADEALVDMLQKEGSLLHQLGVDNAVADLARSLHTGA